MKKENVKLVADSSSDMMTFEGIDYRCASLKIVTAEKEYVDNESLDVKGMVDDLRMYNGRSSTSCPNTEDWLRCFCESEYVFCVTITAALSGSYNSACLAKKQYEQSHPGRRVHVINSKSTGPEMLLIMEKIKELVENGMEFDDICGEIDGYMQKTGLLFMLRSMKNLANNGRVSHIAAKMAGVLGIRALGKASYKGELEMLDKCRGERNSVEAVVRHLKQLGYKGGKIRISHCYNEELIMLLKEKLESEFGKTDMKIRICRGLCSFYAEAGGLLVGFEKF